MYLIRLDDASEYMDVSLWDAIEELLDSFGIKPIVGVIPRCEDVKMVKKYQKDNGFWEKVRSWNKKGWIIAMHGYDHVYISKEGGINPVNNRSEFAGVDILIQKEKIKNGLKIFHDHDIEPLIFFAPGHTFDKNTIIALKEESNIRIISDTIANNIYSLDDFHFIPVQSSKARELPFAVMTFCYHPNTMKEKEFTNLRNFINKNRRKFTSFEKLNITERKKSIYDRVLSSSYFFLRKLNRKVKL